ncbi:MAG: hypothetical protein GWP08_20895, partial [Nitrospiraceae bacterium]|nr:hypothetical protein [Nitrospiraceae bacterium]
GLVSMARPGNFTHLAQRYCQGSLTTPTDLPIPGGKNRERMAYIEDLYTQRGYEYMAYIDPYYFLSRVNVPVMCLIGTNDNLFGSFDNHGFYPFYQGDKSFGYVPNYSHGMASPKHVQAYRAWAAHCLWGRPVTKLTALGARDGDSLVVQAIVRPETSQAAKAAVTEVNLYFCALQGKAFNDKADRYVSVPMERVGDTPLWQARVEAPDRKVYWYVEAVDEAMGLQGFSSTLLEQTPPSAKP